MGELTTRPLDADTWPDFAALVEANNGVWGGCWCTGFHPKGPGWGKDFELNRAEKEERVRNGEAHAALVYGGDVCVGFDGKSSPILHPTANLYVFGAAPQPALLPNAFDGGAARDVCDGGAGRDTHQRCETRTSIP